MELTELDMRGKVLNSYLYLWHFCHQTLFNMSYVKLHFDPHPVSDKKGECCIVTAYAMRKKGHLSTWSEQGTVAAMTAVIFNKLSPSNTSGEAGDMISKHSLTMLLCPQHNGDKDFWLRHFPVMHIYDLVFISEVTAEYTFNGSGCQVWTCI